MNRAKAFGAFWYDFVVGDDWRIALAVIAGLGVTALLAHATRISAWWVLPVGVVVGLSISLWLASHPTGTHRWPSRADGKAASRVDGP